ncbi:MAG: polynucleotide adenylyltransferase PcnB [Myxococcales bacterium]|nr:MAG: polynucleotide adenylyltransferase PcnB [Myxococcales bacterium]
MSPSPPYVEPPLTGPADVPSDLLARPVPGPLVRHPVPLDERLIDPDVARTLRRLIRAGHQAYLVGGCVRDLLLGRRPKDFDVGTSARPEEVRAVFRASRIIGRRFRLVHVLFAGGKIIEVATFRRNPNTSDGDGDTDEEMIIRSDNVYGTVDEDALRRDFTINALFYDIERREILDFASGMRDIERRMVRTINDPRVRFREDPVRILRAIKFAAKLDLGLDPEVVDAIIQARDSLPLAAKMRLFEEVLRLLRDGAGRRAIFLAWELGVLHVLLPELAALLDDVGGDDGAPARVFRLLAEMDARTLERGEPFDDAVLWTLLMLEPALEACQGAGDRLGALMAFLEPIHDRLAAHRRIIDSVRRIVAMLPKLWAGHVGKATRSDIFAEALMVAEISLAARGEVAASQQLRQHIQRNRRPAPGDDVRTR